MKHIVEFLIAPLRAIEEYLEDVKDGECTVQTLLKYSLVLTVILFIFVLAGFATIQIVIRMVIGMAILITLQTIVTKDTTITNMFSNSKGSFTNIIKAIKEYNSDAVDEEGNYLETDEEELLTLDEDDPSFFEELPKSNISKDEKTTDEETYEKRSIKDTNNTNEDCVKYEEETSDMKDSIMEEESDVLDSLFADSSFDEVPDAVTEDKDQVDFIPDTEEVDLDD